MERKRSVDDYRNKYRSGLLPNLKKNRLKLLNEGEEDVKNEEKIKKKPQYIKKRENHFWTDDEVCPPPPLLPLPSSSLVPLNQFVIENEIN